MDIQFKILRYDPIKDEAPHFRNYTSRPDPKDSILEAIKQIRDEQDPSLSFRYSCREAVCGSCAMVINGAITLACRTTVESLKIGRIVIEPLPNLEIQKDLIVDMDPFYLSMKTIQPYLIPSEEPPETGHRIIERKMENIDQYISCIWCGSCYAACPVASRDHRYLGPAALAKLYRFIKDPRDGRPSTHWKIVDNEKGLWGCDTVFRCNEVCPKEVRPADGIEGLRREIIAHKAKKLLKKKS
ncbi:MAG: succinate dehydrogenase/fumarate reductase iron-sulfur subunit [Candidatus Aminicenantes bacterium]|nr:succinate dehydrogenase/fumarate reductase iron-sulfur subunit [Candidatus Aminicenantes bacterium]